MGQADHYNYLQKLCRICGSKRSKGRPYRCQTFEEEIKDTFGVNISDDKIDIHPKSLCYNCQLHVTERVSVKDVVPVEWKEHDDDEECWVCEIKAANKPDSVLSKQTSKRRRADSQQCNVKKEQVPIKLRDMNEFITCAVCKGYIIEVASVTECLHSFCKSCLVKHLQTKPTCPECKIVIHETAPLQHIGFDTKLQDIIYKLVPGLAENETRRVKEFYAARNLSHNGSASRPITPAELPADAGPAKFPPDDGRSWFHTHDVKIALCIEPKDAEVQQMPMKYVRCSMRLKVEHLAKFIKQKIAISDDLELTCNKQVLSHERTLENIWLDTWKLKEAPMRLYYNKK